MPGLESYPQFILWEYTQGIKVPVDHRSLSKLHGFDKGAWFDYSLANTYMDLYGGRYGIGFVLTENDPFFCVDIDKCLLADGNWSNTAIEIVQCFPGAYVEVSQSGTGLHIFGTYTGIQPHKCKAKLADGVGIELYHEKRFIAVTGMNAVGSSSTDCTNNLAWLIDRYFKKEDSSRDYHEWGTGPVESWNGYTDDSELIEKALSSKSGASVFGGRASFADLWFKNESVLATAYPPIKDGMFDASSADAALAQHLAFWTGCDKERMHRLMFMSALKRDKWERSDYMEWTIDFAVSMQKDVHGETKRLEGAEPIGSKSDTQAAFAENVRANIYQSTDDTLKQQLQGVQMSASDWIACKDKPAQEIIEISSHLVQGFQYLSATDQLDYFKGFVYISDIHRVLTNHGRLMKQEQFNAMYGGYVFQLDGDGDKTTRKAWEAFTESQCVRFPKADTMCFRPLLPPLSIVVEEGLNKANAYVEVNTQRVYGDPSPFLTHLGLLIPDTRDREILLSYMAACVQYKGVKFKWAPLIQGVEGNGKTFLSECVAFAVGKRYTHWPKAQDISNKFNGWLFNKILICVEDVYVPDAKSEIFEALKPMITGVDQEMHLKSADQVMGEVYANFIFNTNHKDGLRKSVNDRRLAIFYNPQQSKDDLARFGMDETYFKNLYQWARSGGYAIVNEYLSTYHIDDAFNPATSCQRSPHTSSTHEAISVGIGGAEQEILEAIEEGLQGFCGGWVSSVALNTLLSRNGRARAIPVNKRREILQSLGYDWHPALNCGRVNNPTVVLADEGKKTRLFIKNGHPLASLRQPAEVVKSYEQSQVSEIFGQNSTPFESTR